jgi:hypothetical protein
MNDCRFVSAENLAIVFAGLSFNLPKMRVVLPDGSLLDKARFNVLYGGCTYVLDQHNARITRNAWRAFTDNEAFRPPIIFK